MSLNWEGYLYKSIIWNKDKQLKGIKIFRNNRKSKSK